MKNQNYILKIKNLINKFATIFGRPAKTSESCDIRNTESRDTCLRRDFGGQVKSQKLAMDSLNCPYCGSPKFVKKGFRVKKTEKIQLYRCSSCQRVFTPYITKGKHYPMETILDALSLYHLGYSLEQTCQLIKTRTGLYLPPSSLADYLAEFTKLCRFSRMREYALKKYSPQSRLDPGSSFGSNDPGSSRAMVITATLAHRQLYRYRFHQAKCELMIKEEFQHRRFEPLKEFLEMVPVECPHQYFQHPDAEVETGISESGPSGTNGTSDQKIKPISGTVCRASEAPLTFSKKQMIVRAKQNYATRTAEFVLQSVKDRKLRHEALQKFMLYNDSVTVATEVPVYITRDDLEHMQTQLGFQIYKAIKTPRGWQAESHDSPEVEGTRQKQIANSSTSECLRTPSEVSLGDLPKLITGHIDFLQIRNGQIHILDYKAGAEKERPIEQLTLYAMALSRLTGLRLFEFKCAWFDEKDYFEFYPLHVLHKPRKTQRRRKVYTMEGTYKINQNEEKMIEIRPMVQL
jgi:hypothetical protein